MMTGNNDRFYLRKHRGLADLPSVLQRTRAAIEVSRALLERSQKILDSSVPKPSRTGQARRVVQEHIDDQKALIRMLRRKEQ